MAGVEPGGGVPEYGKVTQETTGYTGSLVFGKVERGERSKAVRG